MASTGPNRARRFSLPDLADDRADEAIGAFLSPPERGRGRGQPGPTVAPASNPFARLEPRVAWMEALRRENVRSLRYRRPAAVVLIAADPSPDRAASAAWLTRVAGPIAHSIHRGVRETDLVTRASDTRFFVLLPETTTREARRLADRVVADCEIWLRAIDAPLVVRAAAAGTTHDVTLDAAFEQALTAIGAR